MEWAFILAFAGLVAIVIILAILALVLWLARRNKRTTR